jgi:uncharacterized protein (TIGR02246 family)
MSRLSAVLFAAMITVGLLPTGARAQPKPTTCQAITDQQVAGLFDRWNKTLATRNPDTVAANYAGNATLLPTVQNGPLIGHDAIHGYFVSFLKQAPDGKIDQRVIHRGCNIAYDVGLYTLTVNGDQPNSRKQVRARYTFVYAPEHGKWLIVHHHSSALPVPAP